MIKKIACTILFISAVSTFSFSQNIATKKTGRPDIPGTFVLELGLNRDLGGPDNFSLFLWGSRSVNIYYQYDIRILKSRFSFVPGIGLSLERYKFKKLRTLRHDADNLLALYTPREAEANSFDLVDVRKSMLVTNYVDVPLDLRYSSKPDDPGRSFKISVGARIGYMYDSFNKYKYKQDGEIKKMKDNQDFNLTKFRYGVSTKVGIGNFSIFGYYNLTNLFQDGEGPYLNSVKKDFPTYTVGISLSSF